MWSGLGYGCIDVLLWHCLIPTKFYPGKLVEKKSLDSEEANAYEE
jgi:hypothetical protein